MRLFINVVCSKDKPEESKKMCSFLDYLKVDYGVSQLEAYPEGDGPPSIGIFVERIFFRTNIFWGIVEI